MSIAQIENKEKNMSVKKLLRIGEPELLKKSTDVLDMTSSAFRSMLGDLHDSMTHYGGVGIAAPQIGYFWRVLMFGFEKSERYPNEEAVPLTVLINPEVHIVDEEQELGWEGCLSVPGYRGLVPRYKKVRYTGLTPEGVKIEREVHDFHARVIQHEVDHLNGILDPMRMTDMSTFGCEDILWQHMTGTPYPDEHRKRLLESWM